MTDWQEKDDALTRDYEFKNFAEALAFVNEVGAVAERLDHHPDILMHGYKYVRISTMTHSAGNKVTDGDRALAAAIDAIGG